MSAKAQSGELSIANVSKTYIDAHGGTTEALQKADIVVKPGEFFTLIGPSGCGKSTLLRLIAGFDKPDEGEISLDGVKVESTHYERCYVFQQTNLFPWASIYENIAAGLRARKVYHQRKGDIAEYITLMGLEGFEKTFPHQVSGGMAQRASLARALINDPKVLLLDEPLGALDSFTRIDLQNKLLELWQQRGTTIVLITHDVDEAVYLSDRIAIMTPRPGRIEEIVDVHLPRPRARNDADYIALHTSIMEKLHLVSKKAQPEFYL